MQFWGCVVDSFWLTQYPALSAETYIHTYILFCFHFVHADHHLGRPSRGLRLPTGLRPPDRPLDPGPRGSRAHQGLEDPGRAQQVRRGRARIPQEEWTGSLEGRREDQ